MTKKTDLWMPLYIGDYLADTGHLTTTQHGAYLLLLMHYWRKRELPTDDKQLAAIAKLPLRIWLDTKETLQDFFHDGWKHKKVESELARRAEVSNKRAVAGARGGAKGRTEQELSNCSDFASSLLKQNGSMTQAQSQTQIDVAVERAGSLVTPEAMQLSEKLLVIAGHSPKFWPPGWCGAGMRVQTWLDQGWKPDVIVAAVTGAAARKRGEPANSVQFFEKAVAEEVARQSAPLPQVEIRQAERVISYGTNPTKSGSLVDSINRDLAALQQSEGAHFELPEGRILRLSE